MIFGAQLGQYTNQEWPHIKALAQQLDTGPWNSLWLSDHFIPPGVGGHGTALESWTLLAGLATVTDRIRLGILASGNTYRNPAHLAKIATTVDHMSGGRVVLGLGAAWYEEEHRAYGWDFPSLRPAGGGDAPASSIQKLHSRSRQVSPGTAGVRSAWFRTT